MDSHQVLIVLVRKVVGITIMHSSSTISPHLFKRWKPNPKQLDRMHQAAAHTIPAAVE